jgi:hypothetical protein
VFFVVEVGFIFCVYIVICFVKGGGGYVLLMLFD